MYCIVCLQNNARDFFCPFCIDNIRCLFREPQIKVEDEVFKKFSGLPMHVQRDITLLTSKRMVNILKADLKSHFHLGYIIKEYTEMSLLRHDELEIPQCKRDDVQFRRYHQYISPSKETL